jgi:hypothetical protein
MSYDVSYGAITPLYAGTAPAAGELNGKVSRHSWKFHLRPGLRETFLVSHSVGTRRGSEQEGNRH